MNIHQHGILILDFGAQYTQLIARRVREVGVYCEIHSFAISPAQVTQLRPAGIILSGGPESVTNHDTPRAPDFIFSLDIPILGICYGMQTMAHQLGGKVRVAEQGEFGATQLYVHQSSKLLAQTDTAQEVWMSHTDKVSQLPAGFTTIAKTQHSDIAVMVDEVRHFYGVQFHPEVTHTVHGQALLNNFVLTICQASKTWTIKNIIAKAQQTIRNQVGQDTVILGLSGGVDSAVVAALLHQIIGDQLVCIFVDHGLLRLQEVEQVMSLFTEHLGIRIITVDAKTQFLKVLQGVTDPEQKRQLIGHTFIKIFEDQAQQLSKVKWLAQGTIYPDVIESGDRYQGKVIKTHHNVGGLPEKMNLKLLEPLRDLFKDEVRQLGLQLGLPSALVHRHPFPGPGLAVRILGEVKQTYLDQLRLADHIFMDELVKHHLYDKVSQAFAVFLPICSVGIMGDARQYAPMIALRAVETTDFMTAKWAKLPHDFLDQVASRIVNEVKGISRVVYDISGKPPATIEWE